MNFGPVVYEATYDSPENCIFSYNEHVLLLMLDFSNWPLFLCDFALSDVGLEQFDSCH